MTFLTLLLMETPLLAGVGLLFAVRRGASRMARSKTKLSVQLDVEVYNRVRIWADKNGMTVSEFTRKTLIEAIPPEENKRFDDSGQKESILDRAFEELDKAEDPFTGVFSMPPRTPQVGVPTEAERTHPAQRVIRSSLTQVASSVPPGPHPCVHLSGVVPHHLKGQCQGTCNQQQQRGKPCFWAPTTARSCQMFEPKMSGEPFKQVR